LKLNEVKQIGNYETDRAWDNPQTGRVYLADGLSPTLNTCGGGGHEVKIVEAQVKQVGNLTENASRDNPQRRRVYDTTGISPTLCEQMGTGGNLQPFIVASRGKNPQNTSDRTPGNHVEQRLEPNSDGICNTLTSVQKDNLVLEPKLVGGIGEKNWGKQWRQGDRVYDSNAVAMALTAQPLGNTGGNSYLYSIPTEHSYRIRKLTPLECWRLMGFTDEDFTMAETVNSNTQLYKQAGNSIVVNVLEAIFRQMIPHHS
jgi:DNA (cytosine-5)-methyltransferase 1